MNESAAPLVTMLVVFHTNIKSINEDECSLKCVASRINWLRLHCCINSFTLLFMFDNMLKMKSPVIKISTKELL